MSFDGLVLTIDSQPSLYFEALLLLVPESGGKDLATAQICQTKAESIPLTQKTFRNRLSDPLQKLEFTFKSF